MAQTLTSKDVIDVIKVGFVMGVITVVNNSVPTGFNPDEPQAAESGSATTANTVTVSQSTSDSDHPLASLFGKYNDEPLWDGFEEAIRRIRAEENATVE